MGKEPTLAHTKLLGERANGETFQSLSGSNIHSAGENSFAGAEAFLLSAEHGLMDALVDTLFD